MVKDGYKKTEAGIIPDEWQTDTFQGCFDTLPNNTLSRAELNYNGGTVKNIHYGDVLIKFPAVTDCQKEEIPYVNRDCVSKLGTVVLHDKDVIIADTAEDETVGKATELMNVGEQRIVSGLHTIPCRPKQPEQFAPKWLGYFINHRSYHNQLLPLITGTKVSSVSKSAIADTVIVIPERNEQERIVDALSDIDELILNIEKTIKKYQAIKQACLQRMFPQNGQSEPKMRLPGFTGAWEQRKLSDLVDVRSGRDYKHLEEGEIPVYGTGGYMLSVSEALSDDEDAIGIGRKGTIDNPYILRAPFWTVDTLFYAVPREKYDLNFVYSIFQNVNWKAKDESTGVPSLSKTTINAVNTMTPDYEEQKRIGDYFSDLDHLITLHQRKLKKYRDIKQGLMDELLTGSIRI